MQTLIELFEHAVLRAAAWPIETAQAFAAPETAAAARALNEAERTCIARRDRLSTVLFDAVPRAADTTTRSYLLAVRRHIHGSTAPLPDPPRTAERGLAVQPDVQAILVEEHAARLTLARQRAEFEAMHAAEMDRQRDLLRHKTMEPRFRKALVIANPVLAARWQAQRIQVDGGSARSRRLEATLFHYLMRAAGRPTPHGTWAGVAPVSLAPDDAEGTPILSVKPAPRAYAVGVNLHPFAVVVQSLGRQPRYRRGYPLRLNPTLFATEDGWRYEGISGGVPAWLTAKWLRLSVTIIDFFQDGELKLAGPLIESIAEASGGGAELRHQLERVVDALVDRGVLQSALAMPSSASDAWAALEAVAPQLIEPDRARWQDVITKIHTLCTRMGCEFESHDASEIERIRQEIALEIHSLWEWAGLPGAAPGPAIYLDLRLPFEVTWNSGFTTMASTVVRELLEFYAADGGAELYRRRTVQEFTDACPTPGAVPLLPLLANDLLGWQGRLRFQAPPAEEELALGPDSRVGVFSRFAPDARLDAEMLAQCDRWERTLEPVHHDHVYRLSAAAAPLGVLPGPAGALLLPLSGKAEVWAGPGRPQPGLFVTRFAGLIGEGEIGPAPLIADLRNWAHKWGLKGVTPVEVIGRDSIAHNTALRPEVTAASVSPHGFSELSLRGLSLVRDRDGRRLLLRHRDLPGLLAPVYNSGAGIGPEDPCSWLLFVLAMVQGWEFVSFGFPALPSERKAWGHLPRLELPGGTVLSRERWTLDRRTVARLTALRGSERYIAWRREVERLQLPDLVHVRCGPAAQELLLRSDSPLAVRCLFDTLAVDAPWLEIVEVPGDPAQWPVVDAEGRHYLAELAVTWTAEGYWDGFDDEGTVRYDRQASADGA